MLNLFSRAILIEVANIFAASCGGDPNAVSGCGTNRCNRLCSNYDKPRVPCTKICLLNACDCKKGFVFDENIGKCVPSKECCKYILKIKLIQEASDSDFFF